MIDYEESKMLRRFSNSVEADESDIDVTPMVDVVFIMLIFFIVTGSFVKEAGIALYSPPHSDKPSTVAAPPIVVYMAALDTIKIQDRVVNFGSIRATITRLKAEMPNAAVIVKVNKQAKTNSRGSGS